MTTQHVQQWLERYIKAWRTAGVALLDELFTDDVMYIASPWRPAISGIKNVKAMWQKTRAGADEVFTIQTQIIATENQVAVVRVEVHYADDDPSQWRDLWILNFATDGRCAKFEEWPFHPGQDDGQGNYLAAPPN